MTKTITHSKTGRPTAITKDVVAKLENVFKLDVPVETACKYAGIHKATYYRNYESNEEFATKIDKAREFARIAASRVVSKAIVEDDDVATARWWLEKKFPNEFGGAPGVVQQFNIEGGGMDIEFVVDEDKTASDSMGSS